MPGKLRDNYSFYELKKIGTLGDFIIANFLKDSLSVEEQTYLKLRLNTFFYIFNHNEMNAYYKEKYPEAMALLGKHPDVGLDKHSVAKNPTHPNNIFHDAMNSINTYLDDDAFEKPIADMIEAVGELSDHLDKYIKKEKLTEAQFGYIMAFKAAIDGFKTGNYKNMMLDNNILLNIVNDGATDLTVNSGTLEPFYNKKTKELSFEPLDKDDSNWKEAINSLDGSPLQESFKKAYNVSSKWETLKQGGDAYRSELITLYDDFARDSRKRFSMSNAAFDIVHEKGYLQNDYTQFVSGSRAPYFIQFEAEARSQLLKAGFPVSDIPVLSQVYMSFKAKEKAKSVKNIDEETIRSNNEAWEQLIAPGAISADERVKRIDTLANYVLQNDDAFLAALVMGRKKAKLNAFEERALSGNVKNLYDALCDKNVDPDMMKSSDEFKAMKETLKKLSEVDRDRNPAKYDFLKEKAIKDTEKYLKYKQDQMREPGKKHKRSETEALRVNTAVSILDGLKRIDKQDTYERNLNDNRTKVTDEITFGDAKKLKDAIDLVDQGRSVLINRINYIKETLQNSQADPNAIWEDGFKKEGSKYYQNMAKSVKRCYELLNDPESSHAEITASLEELDKAAKAYKKDKEGVFTSPPTEGGPGNRYKAAKYMTENISSMITAYNNMLQGLDGFKTDKNVPFKELPISELKNQANTLQSLYRQAFKNQNAAVNIKDQATDHFNIALKQVEIRNKLTEFNPFMSKNYNPDKNIDYYINLKPGMSTSELANAYMTKKCLDDMYKPGVTMDELNEIAENVEIGFYKQMAGKLAKSPAFKKTVTTFPEHAFSKWEVVDKRADEIIEICESNVNNMLNSRPKDKNNPEGKPYKDVYHYALSGTEGSYYGRCAEALVNWMLAIPLGRTITEAMAADTTTDPNEIINTLKGKLTTHLQKENTKFHRGLKFYIDNFDETEKLYDHLLKSYKKDAKDRQQDPMGINRQSRNNIRNSSMSSNSSSSSRNSSRSSSSSSIDAENKIPVI